jgi:hypothetical protein
MRRVLKCDAWGRMEISCTERMSMNNGEVLHRVQEERNILHTTDRTKSNWTAHTLRRNCLLEHVTAGKIEVTGRPGRRRKLVLDDIMKKRG